MALSKSDAATYASLVTVAIFEALDPFRKEAAMPPEAHPILASNVWAYLPIALLCLVAILWFWRLWRPNRATTDHVKPLTPVYTRAELTHITGQRFQSTTVILDGHVYDGCLFQDVTFEWDGGEFYINNSKMGGNITLKTDNSVIVTTVDFLKEIGMLKQEFVDSWRHLPKKSPEKQ